jgi:beta-N-acetylhexosaminidase
LPALAMSFLCFCSTNSGLTQSQIQMTVQEENPDDKQSLFIESLIDKMNIEEQAAQLFVLSLETGSNSFSAPCEELKDFISASMAGGYILFNNNITTVEGTKTLTDAVKEYSKTAPFISIDEEGGPVSRLFSARLPGYTEQPSADAVGAAGDVLKAYNTGRAIGQVLNSIGVNLDFAPVADVLTAANNKVIGIRSYGNDPVLVGNMIVSFQAGLRSYGIMSSPKHFPGHGNTSSDSHYGIAIINSDLEHLANVEYKPFIRAIDNGCEFIMVGHITAPKADPGGLPATLSSFFVTELRNALGFEGVIITDAMNMGAIANIYSSSQAAVMAILAGVDMVLMPKNYNDALNGVLNAVSNGTISRERIRESLRRIFRTKISAGMISVD